MGWKFETINLAASVDALEKFDSEVGKILKKEMRAGANEVAKAARKRIPNSGLSNWGMWTSEENGRDLGFESASSAKELTDQIGLAISSGAALVTLLDDKGKTILVPTSAIAYVEIGLDQGRRVGFIA